MWYLAKKEVLKLKNILFHTRPVMLFILELVNPLLFYANYIFLHHRSKIMLSFFTFYLPSLMIGMFLTASKANSGSYMLLSCCGFSAHVQNWFKYEHIFPFLKKLHHIRSKLIWKVEKRCKKLEEKFEKNM